MIIVKLMGGLGNQMFQYALGKHLALKHHTKLKLDLTFLLDRTPRPDFTFRDYELGIFNINASFATDKEVFNFLNVPKFTHWKDRLKQKIYRYHHFVEEQFNFDEKVLNLPRNTYLEGYWQSEKYFTGCQQEIRKVFTFKDSPSSYYAALNEQTQKCNSVSVHFRRGDYINNPVIKSYHGECTVEYYEQAIAKIRSLVPSAVFFMISDDIAWVKKQFAGQDHFVFVENGKGAGHEDMQLMSQCRHNIIANSSYSWWGAWLNANPEKIVIAPKKWFNDNSRNTENIYPHAWITL